MLFLFGVPHNNNQIKSIQMNGVQSSVKVPQFLNLEFLVTNDKTEAIKIGTLFSNLDNLITLHQREQK